MFQTPKFLKGGAGACLCFDKQTKIDIPECGYSAYIAEKILELSEKPSCEKAERIESITFSLRIPENIRAKIEREITENDEEYVISLGAETRVYAKGYDGFLRALSTLCQLSDAGELSDLLIYDYPAVPERGYRVYMPGRKTMGDFLKMIDFLVYYKFNAIILEIGGAMEYERHPKINAKWEEFCTFVGEYSGKVNEVQFGYPWSKNSIHYENGDSSYLTKKECQELLEYCRARGIEVIPECPSLSHSDYICHAYPEIAELSIDPYPDTYCPSNPKSYEILFDILDEVIEVFKPKRLNIGHDEYYLSAHCPRCKGKSPVDLYVGDVKKIKDYLDERGVSTLLWGEKLCKARNAKGHRFGAWYDPKEKHPEYSIPNFVDCAGKLPRGITYLHWYWVFGTHLDDEYHGRDYPVVFGNFEPFGCMDFRTRINRGIKGAFVSNWGSVEPEYMQRNLQYFELVSSSYALWSDTYDNKDSEDLKKRTYEALYDKYRADIKNPLRVRHSTDCYILATHSFWDGIFIEDEVYCLGNYEITYADGTKASLPVKYGTNIGTAGYVASEVGAEFAAAEGEAVSERNIRELSYSTLPERENGHYVFNHTYENPHPEKEIKEIKYCPREGKERYKVEFEFEI